MALFTSTMQPGQIASTFHGLTIEQYAQFVDVIQQAQAGTIKFAMYLPLFCANRVALPATSVVQDIRTNYLTLSAHSGVSQNIRLPDNMNIILCQKGSKQKFTMEQVNNAEESVIKHLDSHKLVPVEYWPAIVELAVALCSRSTDAETLPRYRNVERKIQSSGFRVYKNGFCIPPKFIVAYLKWRSKHPPTQTVIDQLCSGAVGARIFLRNNESGLQLHTPVESGVIQLVPTKNDGIARRLASLGCQLGCHWTLRTIKLGANTTPRALYGCSHRECAASRSARANFQATNDDDDDSDSDSNISTDLQTSFEMCTAQVASHADNASRLSPSGQHSHEENVLHDISGSLDDTERRATLRIAGHCTARIGVRPKYPNSHLAVIDLSLAWKHDHDLASLPLSRNGLAQINHAAMLEIPPHPGIHRAAQLYLEKEKPKSMETLLHSFADYIYKQILSGIDQISMDPDQALEHSNLSGDLEKLLRTIYSCCIDNTENTVVQISDGCISSSCALIPHIDTSDRNGLLCNLRLPSTVGMHRLMLTHDEAQSLRARANQSKDDVEDNHDFDVDEPILRSAKRVTQTFTDLGTAEMNNARTKRTRHNESLTIQPVTSLTNTSVIDSAAFAAASSFFTHA